MHVATIGADRLALGEGPLWHPLWNELLVVDIGIGDIYRYDAGLNPKGRIACGRPTSALTWQPDGSLLCFHDGGDVARLEHPGAPAVVILNIPEESMSRFNDVISDARGRVICGALGAGNSAGKLYCIEPDLRYRLLLSDVAEPNGLAFSGDGRHLYFADSVAQSISRFDYDVATGSLRNCRVIHRTSGSELPDGLTVDGEDRLYCALWGGGGLLQFDASGGLEARIALDVRWPTSVTFGGSEFDVLFVTSASSGSDLPGETVSAARDGCVIRLVGCGRGRPEYPSRLGQLQQRQNATTCSRSSDLRNGPR